MCGNLTDLALPIFLVILWMRIICCSFSLKPFINKARQVTTFFSVILNLVNFGVTYLAWSRFFTGVLLNPMYKLVDELALNFIYRDLYQNRSKPNSTNDQLACCRPTTLLLRSIESLLAFFVRNAIFAFTLDLHLQLLFNGSEGVW